MPDDQGYSIDTWRMETPPKESEIRKILGQQGLSGYRWSNGPGDVYRAHSHPFHKIIFVLEGSITFILPGVGERVTLVSGDRLYLPAGMLHEEKVGSQGVICIEAHQEVVR